MKYVNLIFISWLLCSIVTHQAFASPNAASETPLRMLAGYMQLSQNDRIPKILKFCAEREDYAYDPTNNVLSFINVSDGAVYSLYYFPNAKPERQAKANYLKKWGEIYQSYSLEFADEFGSVRFYRISFDGVSSDGKSVFNLKCRGRNDDYRYAFGVSPDGKVQKELWKLSNRR